MSITPLLIAGPTASGKSRLGLRACELFDGEIINADSMQIYPYLPIITDQPTPEALKKAPHHLYGSEQEPCSVANWYKKARTLVADILQRGKRPILVGGTGLYFKALLTGIDNVPDIPDNIRQHIRTQQQSKTKEQFYSDACRHDPLIAQHLHANDSQRVARAYEVALTTGQSLFNFHTSPSEILKNVDYIQLMPDRDLVYQRIEDRIDLMFNHGAIEEVKKLDDYPLAKNHPALKALGVSQIQAYLAGECSLEEAKQNMKQKSRNYAKRQYTWFRNQEQPNRVLSDANDF